MVVHGIVMLESTQEQARARAQRAAQETASQSKSEFGKRAFDTLEEYFPEEAEARRRQNRTTLLLLLVGVAIGFLLGILVGR